VKHTEGFLPVKMPGVVVFFKSKCFPLPSVAFSQWPLCSNYCRSFSFNLPAMNLRHRLFLLLLLLPALSFGQQVPRGWVDAEVIGQSGMYVGTQVRLREANLYEFRMRHTQDGKAEKSRRMLASEVTEIRIDGQVWTSVPWSDHMGPRSIMMREVSPGLRYTVYKELQCRCNNSFKNRRAFIFPDGTVVRKKIWTDKPADPLPSGRQIKFSEIPTEVK